MLLDITLFLTTTLQSLILLQINPLMRVLIKTDSHPGKPARPLSISTTYSCWEPTFIIRVFVQLQF